jgi:hypothetical protein
LVSVGTGGVVSNGAVGSCGSVSADGRFVAFEDLATAWIAGDTNGRADVFLRDRVANTTSLVSVALTGTPGDGESYHTHMSADGRFIVFASTSTNLVAGDTNGKRDIFLRDRLSNTTSLLSVGLGGAAANDDSFHPHVSNDGRFVAFDSAASDLVTGDLAARPDVFVRDLVAGTTTRVSVGLGGVELNNTSGISSISAHGEYVAFHSIANNHGFAEGLAPWDTDIFLFHVPTGALSFESVNSSGALAAVFGVARGVSPHGRSIVFSSYATNLGSFLDTNNYVDVFVRDAFPSKIQPYCTAKTSSNGCVASMSAEGVASTSAAAPFLVRATHVNNQKPGLIFYGYGQSSTPFQGGTMCVALPHTRTLIQYSAGDPDPATNCTGVLTVDFDAVIQSGSDPLLVPGATVYCQAWYRDPPGPFHSALSNGLRFPVLP